MSATSGLRGLYEHNKTQEEERKIERGEKTHQITEQVGPELTLAMGQIEEVRAP